MKTKKTLTFGLGVSLVLLSCSAGTSQTVKIMPFGDSITEGQAGETETRGAYRRYLEDQLIALGVDFDFVGDQILPLFGMKDWNFQAVEGYTIERMVDEFGPSLATHRPDIVLMLAGTNNHWSPPVYFEFVERYESLIQLVNDNSPDSKIIIATVPPFGCCHNVPEYWTTDWVSQRNAINLATMNRAIENIVAWHDNVDIARFHERVDAASDLQPDDVHPNASGYRKLGMAFLEQLGKHNVFDAANIDQLRAALNSEAVERRGDLNADGAVDLSDYRYFIQNVLNTNYGDANLDGHFDSRDLTLVFQAAEYEDDEVGNSGWAEGDWNGDFDFTTADLVIAFENNEYVRVSAAMPEPEIGGMFVGTLWLGCAYRVQKLRRRGRC